VLHGGTVQVQSAGPGCGSEFTVRLGAVLSSGESSETERRGPAVEDSIARRVLVVDDSVDAAESLAMLLAFEGHEVHKAHDGADAVRTAERVRPDVVLMDIGLPVLNGYEACRRIRSHALALARSLVGAALRISRHAVPSGEGADGRSRPSRSDVPSVVRSSLIPVSFRSCS
jgi:CheY-like chemotaxis protein